MDAIDLNNKFNALALITQVRIYQRPEFVAIIVEDGKDMLCHGFGAPLIVVRNNGLKPEILLFDPVPNDIAKVKISADSVFVVGICGQ